MDGKNTSSDQVLQRSFYSLLYLVQAVGKPEGAQNLQLAVVSSHMQKLVGDEKVQPEKATLLGLVKVIRVEMPWITCRRPGWVSRS